MWLSWIRGIPHCNLSTPANHINWANQINFTPPPPPQHIPREVDERCCLTRFRVAESAPWPCLNFVKAPSYKHDKKLHATWDCALLRKESFDISMRRRGIRSSRGVVDERNLLNSLNLLIPRWTTCQRTVWLFSMNSSFNNFTESNTRLGNKVLLCNRNIYARATVKIIFSSVYKTNIFYLWYRKKINLQAWRFMGYKCKIYI